MFKKKKGYLLLETLIALMLLVIIITPWLNMTKQRILNNNIQELNTFFETKRILLETLNDENNNNLIQNNYGRFKLKSKRIKQNIYQITVNATKNGKLIFSLVGLKKTDPFEKL